MHLCELLGFTPTKNGVVCLNGVPDWLANKLSSEQLLKAIRGDIDEMENASESENLIDSELMKCDPLLCKFKSPSNLKQTVLKISNLNSPRIFKPFDKLKLWVFPDVDDQKVSNRHRNSFSINLK